MTPLVRNTLFCVCLIGFGVVVGLSWGSHHQSAKAQAAQTQSDQHEGAAQTHAASAESLDRQATAKQAAVGDADARVATAKRELARLQAVLPKQAPVSIEPLPVIPATDNTAAQLAAAEQVITAQDEAIKQRDQVIAALTASRDQWEAAYDESQKALALQKIASEAAVHSESKRGFLHSLETGLVCAAAGYAGGRLQR